MLSIMFGEEYASLEEMFVDIAQYENYWYIFYLSFLFMINDEYLVAKMLKMP